MLTQNIEIYVCNIYFVYVCNICIFVCIGNSKIYKTITVDLILRAQQSCLVLYVLQVSWVCVCLSVCVSLKLSRTWADQWSSSLKVIVMSPKVLSVSLLHHRTVTLFFSDSRRFQFDKVSLFLIKLLQLPTMSSHSSRCWENNDKENQAESLLSGKLQAAKERISLKFSQKYIKWDLW